MAARTDWRAILAHVPWMRMAAGAAAGGASLALSFILRLLGLGAFLPELAVDLAVGVVPGGVESFFIRTMGEGAKALAVLVAVLAFLTAYAMGAVPYRRIERALRNRWLVLGAYAGATTVVLLFAVVPLLGGGILAARTAVGPGFGSFGVLLSSWLYAAVLDYFLVDVASRHPAGFSPSRRHFLVAGGLAVVAVALAFYGLGSLAARKGRLAFATVAEMFAKEVTPTEEFYVVSKNLMDPTVDPAAWRLTVDGLVANPRTWTLADLETRADSENHVTLECVSNEVGGNLISTAPWRGIRLADLLADARPDASADWVALTCADDYSVGIPLTKALDPRTILALRMNGEPLNPRHGAPARIVVPGLYGMFHAKWVTRITLVQGEYLGFWQRRGWTNRGAIRTTAIIATPRPDATVTGPTTIGGVAFAGDRGISRVEVSVDGGSTWTEAALKTPALSGSTWVLWTHPFDPPEAGVYRILARAVDGSGTAQEASAAPPFPDGAAGVDSITLLVA